MRNRKNQILIRMSDAEFSQYQNRRARSGKSGNAFCLACLLNHPIRVVEHLPEMLRQLKTIGNNLNQIAQYFHSGGFYSKSMQDEINRHLTALWQLRQEAIKLGGTYHGRVKTHRNKKR